MVEEKYGDFATVSWSPCPRKSQYFRVLFSNIVETDIGLKLKKKKEDVLKVCAIVNKNNEDLENLNDVNNDRKYLHRLVESYLY